MATTPKSARDLPVALLDPMEVEGRMLIEHARKAALKAHAPYSRFRVGAAVVAGGEVFLGCNVENASFGLTMCAERVAAFKVVSEAKLPITAVAVACIDADPDAPVASRMPCGACRQVLAELATKDANVWVDGAGKFELSALLPDAFVLKGR
jgi:cytidine deaminase